MTLITVSKQVFCLTSYGHLYNKINYTNGVQILRKRQSSLVFSVPNCGHDAPKLVALIDPVGAFKFGFCNQIILFKP